MAYDTSDQTGVTAYFPTGLPQLASSAKRPMIAAPQTAAHAQTPLATLVASGSGPTALASQQNQALANMIEQINQQGTQHSSSWAALAANLGASALANSTKKKSDAELIADVMADRAANSAANRSSITPPTASGAPPLAPAALPPAANAPAPTAATTTAAAPNGDPSAATPDSVENDVRAAYAATALQPGTAADPANNFMISPGYGGDERPGLGQSSPTDLHAGAVPNSPDAMAAAIMQQAGGAIPTQGAASSSVAALANMLAPQASGASQAQPSAMGGGPQGMPPPDPSSYASSGPQAGFPGAAGSSPRVGPTVTPADRDAAIRMVYGEARGEPMQGQQATAAVALNRSILSGQPLSQIVNAPGQFEGMKVGAQLDANSPEYQRIAAALEPVLSGKMADPSGGATGFYSPSAQAALGRQKPAWDDGSGRQIGNQLFFNHPFAGQQMPAPGSVSPYQVASNGPTPPPPSSAINGGQPQPGPQQPMQVQYGPYATPRELATIDALMNSPSPELRQQALEMSAAIRSRINTPIDQDARYDASTGQTTFVPKVPGYGREQVEQAPQGFRAPLPSGMQYGANNVAQSIPGVGVRPMTLQERASFGISPNDRNSYGVGPDGKPVKVADGLFSAPTSIAGGGIQQTGPNGEVRTQTLPGSWTPAQVLEARTNLSTSKPVLDAREAMANLGALKDLATQPGGTKAYAFRDALARIFNPGGIARSNQIELLTNSAGVPDSVKQYFQNLTGDGNLDPRVAQQGLDAAYAFAKSRADQVKGLNASNAALARRHGLDPEDLSVELDPLGDPISLPGQRSAYTPQPAANAQAAAIAAAQDAIRRGAPRAAVIQRLQANGINPGSL